jgi:hypothetical protein
MTPQVSLLDGLHIIVILLVCFGSTFFYVQNNRFRKTISFGRKAYAFAMFFTAFSNIALLGRCPMTVWADWAIYVNRGHPHPLAAAFSNNHSFLVDIVWGFFGIKLPEISSSILLAAAMLLGYYAYRRSLSKNAPPAE